MTQRLNPDPQAYAAGEGPVRIPDELRRRFTLDDAEQKFAVRCHRLVEATGNPDLLMITFLDARGPFVDSQPAFGATQRMEGPRPSYAMDASYLPLLEEIAARDSRIERLMVQGQAVAHFRLRQTAAQAIAAITGKPATYLGLSGEKLDSQAFPQPYKDQDQLLAEFIVDRIEKAQLPEKPQSGPQWQQVNAYRTSIEGLRERFGPQVVKAVRREAAARNIDMSQILAGGDP